MSASDGQACLERPQLDTYSLAADLSGLYLDCPYYEGPLTGYLRVEPGDGRPKVSGLMQVDNTTVDIPLALASSSDGPDLDLDLP